MYTLDATEAKCAAFCGTFLYVHTFSACITPCRQAASTPRGLALSQGPTSNSSYPWYPLAYMTATICVCKHVSTNEFAWICVCVCFGGGRFASNATQRGHHLSLIGTKAATLNLRYNAAPIKMERRHFLPISLMNIKDGGTATASTATHKEKLQPYYFICITYNRQHIGWCIYCLISTGLAVNIC